MVKIVNRVCELRQKHTTIALNPSMTVDSNNVNGNCGNCGSKERGKKLAKPPWPNLRGYSYVLLPKFYKYI